MTSADRHGGRRHRGTVAAYRGGLAYRLGTRVADVWMWDV